MGMHKLRKPGNGKAKEKKWHGIIGIAILLLFFWSVSPPSSKKPRKKQSGNAKVRKGITKTGVVSQITAKEKEKNPAPVQKRKPNESKVAAEAPPLRPAGSKAADKEEEEETSEAPSSLSPSEDSSGEGSAEEEEKETTKKVDVNAERRLVELVEDAKRAVESLNGVHEK